MDKAKSNESLGAAAIAVELGFSEAKVKKVIKELGIEPSAKRGVCKFYSRHVIPRIRAAIAS